MILETHYEYEPLRREIPILSHSYEGDNMSHFGKMNHFEGDQIVISYKLRVSRRGSYLTSSRETPF